MRSVDSFSNLYLAIPDEFKSMCHKVDSAYPFISWSWNELALLTKTSKSSGYLEMNLKPIV